MARTQTKLSTLKTLAVVSLTAAIFCASQAPAASQPPSSSPPSSKPKPSACDVELASYLGRNQLDKILSQLELALRLKRLPRRTEASIHAQDLAVSQLSEFIADPKNDVATRSMLKRILTNCDLVSVTLRRRLQNSVRDHMIRVQGGWKLNTSNPGKRKVFSGLFERMQLPLRFTELDLAEIHASPYDVVAHKASQFDNVDDVVIVEDTSFEIEGAEVGVNVRWLVDKLPQYAGRKAVWRSLAAYRIGNSTYIYEGVVHGTVVPPRGTGMLFDPIFLPEGRSQTLAEHTDDLVSARAISLHKLVEGKEPTVIIPAIDRWSGKWQNPDSH